MKQYLVLLTLLLVLGGSVRRAQSHGIPIDVLANSATNRLFVIEGFEPGVLVLQSGVGIFSDSPGIGVSFPGNGIIEGTILELEISQGLLYWDGSGLATPESETELIVYKDISNFYTVTETSGDQTGLEWGTYPGGSAWHVDGLYQLDPLTVAEGIYGLAFRLAGTDYLPTKPFLLPLIYDPTNEWDASERNEGIELLRSAVDVPFSANFDGDSDVDGLDFLAWQRNFGLLSTATLPSQGDADLDSDVDRSDLAFWEQSFGDQLSPEMAFATTVPEPATLISALLAWIGLTSLCRLSRDFYL